MKIDLLNGHPAIISESGTVLIENITCGIRYTNNEENVFLEPRGTWSITEENGKAIAICGEATLTFDFTDKGFTAQCNYTHEGNSISVCDSFVTFKGKLNDTVKNLIAPEIHENNGVKVNDMLSGVFTIDLDTYFEDFHECSDFGAFITHRGNGYVAGYLTAYEFFNGIIIDKYGNIEAHQFLEHHPLPCGKSLKSDLFHIMTTDNIISGLCDFCDYVVSRSEEKPRRYDVPSGYCTWYYYLGDITGDVISRSADEMAQNAEKLPVRYVQIDDGWQVCYGQWEENEKFGCGMKACADKIRSEGFLPGLWFAPLWASLARVAKEHPEYFAKSRTTGAQTICFDYSVEETCEFMREIFRRATYDWGYKYLKLDLISTCLGDYVYSDPDFNSLKNYRKCMALIKECVPDDTFILGCTAPFLPAVGLADGMRISCDIGGDWSSLKEVMCRVLKRYYYNRRLFVNDADCLIIRKSENEDAECNRHCTRNDDEIQCYISATAASGGILMFSDKLSLLDEDQRHLLTYLFPQNTDAALPLDLTERYIPCVLDCGTKDRIRTVMLINWFDDEIELSFTADNCHVYEFWKGEYKGNTSGTYTAKLKPHTCEVLHITPVGGPAVIASRDALIPDIVQNATGDTLSVTFSKKGETLIIAAEALTCENYRITKISEGLYKVTQTGEALTVHLKTSLR